MSCQTGENNLISNTTLVQHTGPCKEEFRVGVISDTHGLLRPEALTALDQSSLIIHAGDIGAPEILDELRKIAPVVAVRGNNDRGPWADVIPGTEKITLGVFSLFVLHNIKELDFNPGRAGFRGVVSGHSHQPSIQEHHGVLFLNPGSAGPRRFKFPVTLARIHFKSSQILPELVDLLM